MNKQIKVALFTAVTMLFGAGSAIAKTKADPMQEINKQQLEQVKNAKAQRNAQITDHKKTRREKAVEKIKLRAKK